MADAARRNAVVALTLYVVLHAGLSLWLDLAGHQPSFGALIDRHYLLQAILLPVLTPLGWLLFAGLVHAVGGAPGRLRDTALRLAPPLYLSITAVFVIPDIVAFAIWGFDGLAVAIRFTAPAALIAGITATSMAAPGRTLARRITACALGFLALGVFTGAWLR